MINTIKFILFLFIILTAPVVQAQSGSNEKELFVVAQRAFEDGFYDVSLRYVDQLTKEFPKTSKLAEARLLEGQCYFFKKQYLKAFGIFQELLKTSEYKDVVFYWLGETYLKVGDHPKAQEHYLQLLDRFPSSIFASQAYYSLGWSYLETGDYLKAKSMFQKVLELFPANNLAEDAAFKIGECDYNAGQYEGAVFSFNKYAQLYPNSRRLFEAHFNIAEAYYYLEQYPNASEGYRKAHSLATDPKEQVNALIGLGWALFKQEKYDEAMKSFDAAQDLSKNNELPEDDILLGKATLFSAQEKHSQAQKTYSDLIEMFGQSARLAEGYLGRANEAYLLNDYPAAIGDYQKLIELFAKDDKQQKTVEKARFGLAWTYLKSGALEQAIESFKGVLDRAESPAVKVSTLTQIGDAYQEAGKFDKAIETYDRILKDMPDTPYSDYVQYRLGVVLLKADRVDASILAFQAAQANYPRSRFVAEVAYYLGAAYFRKQDWAATIEVLQPFLSESAKNGEFTADARYLVGLALFNQKQYDKSLALFLGIVKDFSSYKSVVENAKLGVAKSRYESGSTKEGLLAFQDIVLQYPKTDAAMEALMWMGQHSMSAGLYDRAIEDYEQVVKDFPDHERVGVSHFELGRAYQALGQFDKAVEQFGKVTDGDLAVKAKLTIAEIFSRDLDVAKAEETYQKIIATSPDFKRDALVKIAGLRRQEGAYDDEVKIYDEALQAPLARSQVTNVQLQFLIGDTYELAGNPQKAVEAYFKVPYLYVRDQVWVVKAYLRIAKIYENLEEWDKALTAYGKVVEMNVEESKFAQERVSWVNKNRSLP